ncbi:phosphotransferase [Rhizocola hellebori]|uniref:Phosphotransferase n=1 Tax=Rhizocola hellebori TaxID=1392758 RepID=A0A8J3Q6S0_9ACTN|nr:phosphotransferase [Rhizocola hellebori]
MVPAPLTGPVEVTKDRPWSLVAKVPTESGLFWFKENRGQTLYEAGLMQALWQWAPDAVLQPVAVHEQRGWSLLPDGGPTLRETGEVDWPAMLTLFAQLQRDLAGRADQMLALGVPDHRPAKLAELAATLPMPEGALPVLQRHCEELAASVIPASIQHDDLHDGNVFSSGRFFDWGDASVQHPFGVLLVSLRVAADKLGVEDGDPSLAPLRDAYLRVWSDLASPEQLLREAELAVQVAKVSRALSWQRSLVNATQPHDFGDPVTGWLAELLVNTPR